MSQHTLLAVWTMRRSHSADVEEVLRPASATGTQDKTVSLLPRRRLLAVSIREACMWLAKLGSYGITMGGVLTERGRSRHTEHLYIHS